MVYPPRTSTSEAAIAPHTEAAAQLFARCGNATAGSGFSASVALRPTPTSALMHQTGLVIVIPEAETRFGEMRRNSDVQARLGVPAHITVLFPFMPPELIDAQVRRRLKLLFKRHSPFMCQLARVGRFPATTYLAPTNPAPFVELTRAVVDEFPQYPPYGGAHHAITPHLTIADGDPQSADLMESQVRAELERGGPVTAQCGWVRLLENSTGQWRTADEFALVGHQG